MLLDTDRPAVDVSPLPWDRLSRVAMPSPIITVMAGAATVSGNATVLAALP